MNGLNRFRARRQGLSAIALLLILTLLLGTAASLTACQSTKSPEQGSTQTDPADATSESDRTPADTQPAETSPAETQPDGAAELLIENGGSIILAVGETLQLRTNIAPEYEYLLNWRSTSDAVTVSSLGFLVARSVGSAMVTVAYGDQYAITLVQVVEASTETDSSETNSSVGTETGAGTLPETTPETAPETIPETAPETAPETELETRAEPVPEAEGSPAGYQPAASYEEALARSARGELSGYLWLMDQEPNIDPDRPMQNGKYVRNSLAYFADDNTYVVLDSDGDEVFRVYRGGGYITLEEVAAYLYAFGDVPANYIASKNTSVGSNIWGEYLRLNHSEFSGDTSRYPYEPELPNISGCGGDLQYYEIDIGTTGTDCDPSYTAAPYNNGTKITRGAARIVYARFDANGNKIIDPEEKYIFYTYNHYNDFREYLNYYNGWGEMFGNITGGGTISDKYDCNPTDYVPVVVAPLWSGSAQRSMMEKQPAACPGSFILYIYDKRQPLFGGCLLSVS